VKVNRWPAGAADGAEAGAAVGEVAVVILGGGTGAGLGGRKSLGASVRTRRVAGWSSGNAMIAAAIEHCRVMETMAVRIFVRGGVGWGSSRLRSNIKAPRDPGIE
jgi:hypothetical protein